MSTSRSELSLLAVGDVYLNRRDASSAFQHVKPLLERSDVVFANLEGPISGKAPREEEMGRIPPVPRPLWTVPETASALADAGIDIVSFASNHSMDFGEDVFVETLDLLRQNHVLYVGAGRNEEEAQKPVIMEKKGMKIAFVAFEATHYRYRGKATEDRPGINKITVEPLLPPPHIYPPDLVEMKDIIKTAKSMAPAVVASFHWGVSPLSTLTTFQPVLGHAAVDAGADLILGHHPHQIQGVEVYRGKVICYSVGNFIFEYNRAEWLNENLVFHCVISDGNVREPSIVFGEYINPGRQPKIIPQRSGRGVEIFKKMSALSAELGTTLVQGDDATKIKL